MKISKVDSVWQKIRYSKAYRSPIWLIRKLFFSRINTNKFFNIKMRLGHQIKLRPSTRYLHSTLISRQYHDENVFLMSKFAQKDGVIFDIGANIGLCSCAYAQLLQEKSIKIFAVEAIQKNFNLLQENISLNKFNNIHPFRLAFGDKEGELTFLLDSEDFIGNAASSTMMNAEDIQRIESKGHYKETVPMTTMKKWAEENRIKRCDYIKIDIEGAELFVLRASEDFLRETRPVIQTEFNKYWLDNLEISIKDIYHFFNNLDYELLVEQHEEFEKINIETFDKYLVDLLAIPKEKLSKMTI